LADCGDAVAEAGEVDGGGGLVGGHFGWEGMGVGVWGM